MNTVFEYKDMAAEVKDIDEQKGIVTGYFAAFGNKDYDNDIIAPGSFTKTLNEKAIRVKHLWQHDANYPLSSPDVLKEDAHGLYFESKISKTSYGKDVLQLYKDGVIDNHSIGYEVTRKENQKDGVRLIKEMKLWEGSTVTFGANPNTPFVGMKSLTKEEAFLKLHKLIKAGRNGKYENEELFDLLDIQAKQLEQYILNISDKSTTPPTSTLPDEIGEFLTQFIHKLN